jgi:hypothetical protein
MFVVHGLHHSKDHLGWMLTAVKLTLPWWLRDILTPPPGLGVGEIWI